MRSLPGEVLVPFVGPRFAFRLRLDKGAPNAKQTLLPVLDKKFLVLMTENQTWNSHDLNVSVANLGKRPRFILFGSESVNS